MSDTIEGYRLTDGTNIFDFLREFRTVMNPIRDALDARRLALGVAQLIDEADLAGVTRPDTPLFKAWRTASEREGELPSSSRGHDPNEVSVRVGDDPATGRLYVMLFDNRHAEYRNAFEALAGIEPFHYWDNVEHPADITQEQWDERGAIWGRVIPGMAASESTWVHKLRPTGDFPAELLNSRRGEVLAAIPPKVERAKAYAENEVLMAVNEGTPVQELAPTMMQSYRAIQKANLGPIEIVIARRLNKITLEDLGAKDSTPKRGHAGFQQRLRATIMQTIHVNNLKGTTANERH